MLTLTRNLKLGYILLFGITLICLTYIPVQDAGAHDGQHSYTWNKASIADTTLYTGNEAINITLPKLTSNVPTDRIRYKINGLPAGLHVSYASGYLVGTPTEAFTLTQLTYTGYVVGPPHYNRGNTLTFNLTVAETTYQWKEHDGMKNFEGTAIMADFVQGKSHSMDLPLLKSPNNSKVNPLIQYKIDGLPNGLSFDSDSRELSGTPTEAVSNKMLTYIGYVPGGHERTLDLYINVARTFEWDDNLSTTNLQSVEVGLSTGISLPKLIASNGEHIQYTATGLPDGLYVTLNTGTLYGTPTMVVASKAFTYTAKVRTFDSGDLAIKYFSRTFIIRVDSQGKSSPPPQQTEDIQTSPPPEEVTADGVEPQANQQIDPQPTESAEQVVQVVTPQQTPQRSPAQSLQAPEPQVPQVSQDEERTEAVVATEEVATDEVPPPVTPTEPIVLIDADQRPPMYWIDKDAGTLHRLVGDVVENLYPSVSNATNLVVDTAGNKLYWTEQTKGEWSGKIQSAGLDLTNIQTIHEQPNAPRSLAFDAVNNTLYFTNGLRRIQRVNVDGNPGFRWDLIISDEKPKHLTVDGAGGKIYWAEKLYGTLGEIKSANLDGSGIRTLKKWIAMPTSLCVNTTANHLYFTNFEAILRVNVNDPLSYISATHVISGLDSPTSVAVDSVDNKLYWAEGDKIQRANLDGTNVEDVATTLGMPAGITVAPVAITIEEVPAAPVQVASDKTTLLANYPNPFNPETWIPYQLQNSGEVRVTIYNQNGVLVRELSLGHQAAGSYTSRSHAAHWDGRNWQGERVASGIYFYQLTTDETSPMRKMVILK